MALLRGRYRYRLLINARRSADVQQVIRDWLGASSGARRSASASTSTPTASCGPPLVSRRRTHRRPLCRALPPTIPARCRLQLRAPARTATLPGRMNRRRGAAGRIAGPGPARARRARTRAHVENFALREVPRGVETAGPAAAVAPSAPPRRTPASTAIAKDENQVALGFMRWAAPNSADVKQRHNCRQTLRSGGTGCAGRTAPP